MLSAYMEFGGMGRKMMRSSEVQEVMRVFEASHFCTIRFHNDHSMQQ